MSDRAQEVKLIILEAVVKGYQGDIFIVKKKREERGPALRVIDDDRGQLGNFEI